MRLSVLFLFLATTASAQLPDTLQSPAGTTIQPGTLSLWTTGGSGWQTFGAYSAHLTYTSETGPEEQRNEVFSTNWLILGGRRDFGRGFLLVRGRMSAEPWTIPDEGYPQMLQYIPSGNPPLVDAMRPHSFLGEAAIEAGWRPSASTALFLYAGLAGDPALGPAPHELRLSSKDFAEAPHAWDIQESYHGATSVVSGGFTSQWITIDASVFHDASSPEDYTSIDSGDIDSMSARLTLTPSPAWALQVSRGELGEELAQRTISSASLSYAQGAVAMTALWTQREYEDDRDSESAYGIELLLRGGKHSFMARGEWVDRPATFPEPPFGTELEQTTHLTAGYLYDIISRESMRYGLGVNVDYHTQSHELPERYGHKPQTIFAFMRFTN